MNSSRAAFSRAGRFRAGTAGRSGLPGQTRVFASAVVALAVAGCSAGAQVHPRFGQLKPKAVSIEIRNETVHRDLERLSTAGIVQGIFARGEVNVLLAIEIAAREQIGNRGYALAAAAAGSDGPSGVADLTIRITNWGSVAAATNPGFRGALEFELKDRDSGELLYESAASFNTNDALADRRRVSTIELEQAIRRAVRVGLASLPDR